MEYVCKTKTGPVSKELKSIARYEKYAKDDCGHDW